MLFIKFHLCFVLSGSLHRIYLFCIYYIHINILLYIHIDLCPDPIILILILDFTKFTFSFLYLLPFNEADINLVIIQVPLHPVQGVHLCLDHPDHVLGGEVAPVVQLLTPAQSHVLAKLGGQVVLHGDVAHVHLVTTPKVLCYQSLVLREAGFLLCSELADEFLPTAVLVHLSHVSVPVVDVEAPLLHLPLDPPELHQLRVLCVPLASSVSVRGGAVVVMSPGLLVPSVVGTGVVMGGGVVVVRRLVTSPTSSQVIITIN